VELFLNTIRISLGFQFLTKQFELIIKSQINSSKCGVKNDLKSKVTVNNNFSDKSTFVIRKIPFLNGEEKINSKVEEAQMVQLQKMRKEK